MIVSASTEHRARSSRARVGAERKALPPTLFDAPDASRRSSPAHRRAARKSSDAGVCAGVCGLTGHHGSNHPTRRWQPPPVLARRWVVRIGTNEQSHSNLCRADDYDIHAASRRPARCMQGHPVQQVQVWQACEQEQLRWCCSRGAHGFTCLFAGRERASLEA